MEKTQNSNQAHEIMEQYNQIHCKTKEINGTTRLCGLIGNPVEHTLSPMIHNTLAALKGFDMVYVPFLVQNNQVETAVKGAFALHVLGMNVTVPHKSEVMKSLVAKDPLAEKIGAVNTLVRVENGYKGYNTDMSGLKRAMTSEGINIAGSDVIILGAGGAARAVTFLCATEKASSIHIMNRTLDKAKTIAEEVNAAVNRECVQAMSLQDYHQLPEKRYLVIQSTSVGLSPNNEDVVISNPDFYEMIEQGFDLIYKPEETMFMKLVKQAGGQAYNGLKMLLYQGIDAFELWTQTCVSDEDANLVYQLLKESTCV